MRKRIYEIIEVSKQGDTLSRIYDFGMMFFILLSIVPMCFKSKNKVFLVIEIITVIIFIIDYIFRLMTADYRLQKGKKSFLLYPFTFMAIVDLLSILPSLKVISKGFKALRLLRLGKSLKTFRVFKVFKAFRYSKNIEIISNVFAREKGSLITVFMFAAGYIFIISIAIFNVEPNTFETFFDAIYWATVSLTTVGYGDIYAVSTLGRIITMISSIVGIAIIALPSSIITAGYMYEINRLKSIEDQ